MGGIIILTAIILPTLLLADIKNSFVQILLISTIWMGCIGFIDDYLKSIKKVKKGLVARYKLAGQVAIGLIITFWIYNTPAWEDIRTLTSLPFLKDSVIDFGLIYPLMIILVVQAHLMPSILLMDWMGLQRDFLQYHFLLFQLLHM